MIEEACGLPAMPTRLRTVDDDVNSTASKPPVLMASRTSAAGGAARTVRYAVTSSTAQPSSSNPADSVSVAMSARGSSTRSRASYPGSYGGQSVSSPSLDWSPLGTRSGRIPHAIIAAAVCSPTHATLTPARARESRPSSSIFSRIARAAFVEVRASQA
jgi:hypothetical protein